MTMLTNGNRRKKLRTKINKMWNAAEIKKQFQGLEHMEETARRQITKLRTRAIEEGQNLKQTNVF
jgi:hypothetical protein